MVDVDLTTDLLSRQRDVLRALQLLSIQLPADRWCVVGGMMVLIAARAEGRQLPRAEQTKDADVLVDVCVHPGVLSQAADVLTGLGYGHPEPGWYDDAVARCTFVSGMAQIDLLGPDDSPAEDLATANGVTRLAIPGGRRALETAQPVRITYDLDRRDVEIPVPLLPGAIAVKAAAALDPRTSGERRHAQDVAALLAIIDDPLKVRAAMSDADVELLGRLSGRLYDDGDPAWDAIPAPDRQEGQAALRPFWAARVCSYSRRASVGPILAAAAISAQVAPALRAVSMASHRCRRIRSSNSRRAAKDGMWGPPRFSRKTAAVA